MLLGTEYLLQGEEGRPRALIFNPTMATRSYQTVLQDDEHNREAHQALEGGRAQSGYLSSFLTRRPYVDPPFGQAGLGYLSGSPQWNSDFSMGAGNSSYQAAQPNSHVHLQYV
jgi:hypothetical protein